MKIIITKTFLKDYKKICKNLDIEIFTKNILSIQNLEKMYLKRPILKLKIKISNIHIRLACKYIEDRLLLFPILIYKKSDKNYWNNLVWENVEEIINQQLIKIESDLQKWNYNVYKK